MAKAEDDLLTIARTEAQRMAAAVEAADEEAAVTMNVRQFRQLAQLLANVVDEADAGFTGTRYWVPLAEYSRLKQRTSNLEAKLTWSEIRF